MNRQKTKRAIKKLTADDLDQMRMLVEIEQTRRHTASMDELNGIAVDIDDLTDQLAELNSRIEAAAVNADADESFAVDALSRAKEELHDAAVAVTVMGGE